MGNTVKNSNLDDKIFKFDNGNLTEDVKDLFSLKVNEKSDEVPDQMYARLTHQ